MSESHRFVCKSLPSELSFSELAHEYEIVFRQMVLPQDVHAIEFLLLIWLARIVLIEYDNLYIMHT